MTDKSSKSFILPRNGDQDIPCGGYVLLSDGAQQTNTSYEVFRRAINRLKAGYKDPDGRVWVPSKLVWRFKTERRRSGYLHPRGAKLADLLPDTAA
jgi:hypothetical protein